MQRLSGHLEKKLPCDLKCRDCDHAEFPDRFKYYAHRKSMHSKPSTSEESEKSERDSKPSTSEESEKSERVPLQDFIYETKTTYIHTIETADMVTSITIIHEVQRKR